MMKIARDAHEFDDTAAPICMAAGFFDGVHTGHRRVLESALSCVADSSSEAWVLTFDTHPAKVLRPEKAPLLLTAVQHKLALLEQCGMDGCLLMPFTTELAAMTPEEFVDYLCTGITSLKEIIVGRNWRFGSGQSGTPDRLAECCRKYDVTISVVEPVIWGENTVSSSRIREAVLGGNLDEASAMLGRRFSVVGTVTHGRSIGRTLGFPTANIDPHNEVVPPSGVYAAQAVLEGRSYPAVANVGCRPTFEKSDDAPTVLELHLPGVDMELYGLDLEAVFVEKLRDERLFETPDELAHQIRQDVSSASELLSKENI